MARKAWQSCVIHGLGFGEASAQLYRVKRAGSNIRCSERESAGLDGARRRRRRSR